MVNDRPQILYIIIIWMQLALSCITIGTMNKHYSVYGLQLWQPCLFETGRLLIGHTYSLGVAKKSNTLGKVYHHDSVTKHEVSNYHLCP